MPDIRGSLRRDCISQAVGLVYGIPPQAGDEALHGYLALG